MIARNLDNLQRTYDNMLPEEDHYQDAIDHFGQQFHAEYIEHGTINGKTPDVFDMMGYTKDVDAMQAVVRALYARQDMAPEMFAELIRDAIAEYIDGCAHEEALQNV